MSPKLKELRLLNKEEIAILDEIMDPETWVNAPVDREGMLYSWINHVTRAYTQKSFEQEVAGFPKTAAERDEDLAGARAAQGLIERVRRATSPA